MKTNTQARRLTCLVLCLIATLGGGEAAQTSGPKAARQSDVIYGRKFGVALTMEVFTAPTRNGIGVCGSSAAAAGPAASKLFRTSFERRIAPLLEHGYTVFAVIHAGGLAIFNLRTGERCEAGRPVRLRHRAAEFGLMVSGSVSAVPRLAEKPRSSHGISRATAPASRTVACLPRWTPAFMTAFAQTWTVMSGAGRASEARGSMAFTYMPRMAHESVRSSCRKARRTCVS